MLNLQIEQLIGTSGEGFAASSGSLERAGDAWAKGPPSMPNQR